MPNNMVTELEPASYSGKRISVASFDRLLSFQMGRKPPQIKVRWTGEPSRLKRRVDEVARSDNGAGYVNPHPKTKP